MKPIVCALLAFVSTLFRSRHSLQLEIVAYGANIRPDRMILLSGNITENLFV